MKKGEIIKTTPFEIVLIIRDFMGIKSVSIRIDEEILNKIGHVADYEGRSVNSHGLVLIRENIKKFEEKHKQMVDAVLNGTPLITPGREGARTVAVST